jgi:glycosyltransferase involved in cell wall biosynthesis
MSIMDIAILGCRGVPANYSGFETCAEELGARLVEKGHAVTCYCSRPYSTTEDKYFKGIRRIVLPTINTKSFDKLFFAILSLIHVCFTKNQIVLILGLNIPLLALLPKLLGKAVVINVDGLEWKRKKWGYLASRYLLLSQQTAVAIADEIIADSRHIQRYYHERYKRSSTFIAYGADFEVRPPAETLRKHHLEPRSYILYVGRFTPENNTLLVREAFDELPSFSKKLVMVGGSHFDREYVKAVKNTRNPNIIFTGFVYGESYKELLSNAFLYIQASEVGGTHPALVEAIGLSNFILANDVPEHREVLQDAGLYYNGKKDLIAKILYSMHNQKIVTECRTKARRIAELEYSWESITEKYETLFFNSLKK